MFFDDLAQLRSIVTLQIYATDCAVTVTDSHLFADGTGGTGVIAGDHFDADTGTAAGLYCSDGLFTRGVDDADHPKQGQSVLDVSKVKTLLAAGHDFEGDGQQPLSPRRHLFHGGFPVGVVEGGVLTIHAL